MHMIAAGPMSVSSPRSTHMAAGQFTLNKKYFLYLKNAEFQGVPTVAQTNLPTLRQVLFLTFGLMNTNRASSIEHSTGEDKKCLPVLYCTTCTPNTPHTVFKYFNYRFHVSETSGGIQQCLI